jgi:hypothetical protein
MDSHTAAFHRRQRGGGIAHATGEGEQAFRRRPKAQDNAGVDHVLAGGAEMHVARRVRRHRRHLRGEFLDERDGERAGPARGGRKRGGVEAGASGDVSDRPRCRIRNDASPGGGTRERSFEARHRGEQALVRERLRAGLVPERVLQVGHRCRARRA